MEKYYCILSIITAFFCSQQIKATPKASKINNMTAISLQTSFPDIVSIGVTLPLASKKIRAHIFASPPFPLKIKHNIPKETIADIPLLGKLVMRESNVDLDLNLGPKISFDISIPLLGFYSFIGLSYNRMSIDGKGKSPLYLGESNAQVNVQPNIKANIDFISTRIGAIWEKQISRRVFFSLSAGLRIPLYYPQDSYKVKIGLQAGVGNHHEDISRSLPSQIRPKEQKTRQDLKNDFKFITSILPLFSLSLSYSL